MKKKLRYFHLPTKAEIQKRKRKKSSKKTISKLL